MARRTQLGVALGIVLWFVAAMAVLVSGMVYQARTDIRMAQLHHAKAKVEAAGDGAILLMLAATRGVEEGERFPMRRQVDIGGQPVEVSMIEETELVGLNDAPMELLQRLFVERAGLDAAQGKYLAENVIKFRSITNKNSTGGRFEAPEDLLKVEGINRALWDSIRDTVSVGGMSRLPGTAGGRQRELPPPPTEVGSAGDEPGAAPGRPPRSGNFRVDALVRYGDTLWLRRKWVSMGTAPAASPLPWQFTRIEAPRVLDTGGQR